MPDFSLPWSSLTDALGVTPEQIDELLEPFVSTRVSRFDRRWQIQVWRQRYKVLRRLWRAPRREGSLPRGRSVEAVQAEYGDVWSRWALDRYDLRQATSDATPWLWRDQRLLANTLGATRWRQLLLIKAIERVRPKTVLEVGCGNGINLVMLACRFPDIEFTGIELTAEGHAAAQSFQQTQARLPEHLQDFAPQPLADLEGFRRVRFVQGSATALPFENGAFDLAITVLALEQMEQVRARALAEIARVVRSHALMIEPFADANRGFWQRLNVDRRNYFRGRIGELADYGLRPLVACADLPQKTILRAALVLSERASQASG
jgi:SAM-dependent methyltransferase